MTSGGSAGAAEHDGGRAGLGAGGSSAGGSPSAGGAPSSGGREESGGSSSASGGAGGHVESGGAAGAPSLGGQSGSSNDAGRTSSSGGAPASGGASGNGGAGGTSGKGGAGGSSAGSTGSGGAGAGGAAGSTSSAARYDAIYSGSPWYDDQGNVINAHGAGILKEAGKYYWFGERHSDTSNAFTAFNVYSSSDLQNWKFERQALTVQANGILGPNRVGERAKVLKCSSSGEFVMFMHTDNLTYTDEAVGYATSATITGPYAFKGALQFDGASIARWDMGVFQDTDGSAYVLGNGGDIYRLAADCRGAATKVASSVATGGESPAMFKAGDTYFFLFSNRTSWERNDNFYYSATSLAGPWTNRGKFAPSGVLTWNSQTTFVLPVVGSSKTTYLFMGDRWSYPRQGSAATYVWQPLSVSGTALSIPAYGEAWSLDPATGASSAVSATGTAIEDSVTGTGLNQFNYTGAWARTTESRSATAGDAVSIRFSGTQIKLYGVASTDGGYATFSLVDANEAVVVAGTLDFYSKYRDTTNELKLASPRLPNGTYTLKLTVVGAHSTWSDKAGTVYGSTGNYVSIDRAVVASGT